MAPFIVGVALFAGLLLFATVAFRDIRRDQIEAQYGTRPDEPPGFFVRLIRACGVGVLAIAAALASISEFLRGIGGDFNALGFVAGLIAAALLASGALWILFSKAPADASEILFRMPPPGADGSIILDSGTSDRPAEHPEPPDGVHRRFALPSRTRGLLLLGAAVLLALLDGWISGTGAGYDPGLAYLALLVAGGLTIWGLRLVLRA